LCRVAIKDRDRAAPPTPYGGGRKDCYRQPAQLVVLEKMSAKK
jgi:hypothetical protein